jgi:hypothetical protein
MIVHVVFSFGIAHTAACGESVNIDAICSAEVNPELMTACMVGAEVGKEVACTNQIETGDSANWDTVIAIAQAGEATCPSNAVDEIGEFRYKYVPFNGRGINVRRTPSIDGDSANAFLRAGETFFADHRVRGADETITFVRLNEPGAIDGGDGWLFDRNRDGQKLLELLDGDPLDEPVPGAPQACTRGFEAAVSVVSGLNFTRLLGPSRQQQAASPTLTLARISDAAVESNGAFSGSGGARHAAAAAAAHAVEAEATAVAAAAAVDKAEAALEKATPKLTEYERLLSMGRPPPPQRPRPHRPQPPSPPPKPRKPRRTRPQPPPPPPPPPPNWPRRQLPSLRPWRL